MQRKFWSPLTLAQSAVLAICLTTSGSAQQSSATDAPFNTNAYRIGERLTYNVDYSRFYSAAHIELYVAGRDNFFGREGIQLKAHVETKGVVSVALLSINNDYTTYIFPDSGLPYRAQHVVRQAGRTSEASVDYTQPPGGEAQPAQLNSGQSAGTLDLLSAVYRVRAMPLQRGASYYTTVKNEGEEYRAQIKVDGRELIRTSVGSFDAIATHVNMKSGPDYDIRAYFTDDEWHVPVLVTARYRGGEISIQLAATSVTGPPRAPQPKTVVPTPPTTPTPIATPTPSTRTSAPLDLPFKVGEQLNYRVYLGKGDTSIGSINFEIKTRGRFFNRDALQIVASAQATGPAGFAVKDQITSYVDPSSLLPFRTEINLSEGKYRQVRNYDLDQDKGLATAEGSKDRVEIPVGTHDLVSAFYALRTFDLTPKQRGNSISAMTIHRPRVLTVKSVQRETIDLNGQKISAIQLQLTTDDPQADHLQIRIWVGDDARHLPLRIAAVTDLGAVHADLIVVPAPTR
ncbi:MAG TPA: DUF3108 domain-containing protein [Pyrinomonadaceae bacterium]|nr:DUF3108 domain-containing protein [Pyrinomonadaceae bacterium]